RRDKNPVAGNSHQQGDSSHFAPPCERGKACLPTLRGSGLRRLMRLRRFLVFLGCSLFSISQGRCLAATPLAELREKANQVDAQTGGKDWKEAEIGQQFELRDR